MGNDLIRWIQTVFIPAATSCRDTCWHPASDVYRIPHGWLVKFDLAGVEPEDVEVQLTGRRLTVRGVRRDCAVEEGCRSYQLEIAYSRFERSIEFPVDMAVAQVDTEYRAGMLLVRIRTEVNEP